MNAHDIDNLITEIRDSPVIAALEAMARNLVGIILLIYIRHGDHVQELYASGRPAVLPDFCRVIRRSSAGRRRCSACRRLIAFGATYRGLSEFSCHGGVSLVAAPGDSNADHNPDESIVVASCAFAHVDTDSGWRAARTHAKGLPVELAELKEAYRRLPTLEEDRVKLVNAIVGVAAVAVGEIHTRITSKSTSNPPLFHNKAKSLEAQIGSALKLSRDSEFHRQGDATSATLIQLVMGMASRDPGLPFSVANISRAARISPNYFSMLFRKHAGQTFVSFLNEKRIDLAKQNLRDLRLSVAEVADMSGFNDPGYFGRRFKQSTGKTPEQWRRNS